MTRSIDYATLQLKDALDLAILIEEEARERYEELSRLVGVGYPGDASDFFKFMASNEKKHGAELRERRRQLFQDEPPAVHRDMIFDVEAPEYGSVRVYMSPRQAMEVAIESEQKAYEFFTEALAGVADAEIRRLFEELQQEEKGHREMLERRIDEFPAGPDIEEGQADEPSAL